VYVDYDDCSSTPCMNGATCKDGTDSYTCACIAGYNGTACETGKLLFKHVCYCVFLHVHIPTWSIYCSNLVCL